jgi:uncharacterized membrane protein
VTVSTEVRDGDAGKASAIVVYVIYLLGVFSAHTLSPIGLIWAYVARGEAAPWVRTHFDIQIRMFWIVFLWLLGLGAVALLLSFVLIGLLLWPVWGVAAIVFTIWFAVRSVLGLMALAQGRPAP